MVSCCIGSSEAPRHTNVGTDASAPKAADSEALTANSPMPPRQQRNASSEMEDLRSCDRARREQNNRRQLLTATSAPSINRCRRRAELTDAEREAARAADRRRHQIRLQDERNVERRRERESAVRRARGLGLSLDSIPTLCPPALRTPWRSTPCQYCGALLLESEPLSWCCRNGTKTLDPLPPLPSRIQSLVDRSRVDVNVHSRSLNYLFSLSAIGVSEHFTSYTGTVHALYI
jgi:hypothetical protein